MRSRGWLALAWLAAACAADAPEPRGWLPGERRGDGSVRALDPAFAEIVPADARVEKLAGGFGFLEGPVWRDGALLFSDIPANAILRWAPGREVETFLRPVSELAPGARGGSNGLALDAEGRLVLCEHGARRVSRIEADGRRRVLASHYRGLRLNSPNDLAIASDGAIWFTDPPYGLHGQERSAARELAWSGVYRLAPDGALALVDARVPRPNGIALAPDGRTLYVANSSAERAQWFAYALAPDGTAGARRVFFDATGSPEPGVPDGMATDRAGNLFATGPGGVLVITPDGRLLGAIRPDEVPANVAWGGPDGRTLYVTARSGVYRIAVSAESGAPGTSNSAMRSASIALPASERWRSSR